ncbi:proteasome subunit alpha type-7-1-like [Teleopsis dalmanni]|uniref:proteasome subunit alpha type-7-1-like n=1 Tax=Teleopsis dalmanni TaxID=139649 RepID=UPI0018CE18A8|nr:proteasome subunit alpha type-7-1-like [Teleopsis dalmanni]
MARPNSKLINSTCIAIRGDETLIFAVYNIYPSALIVPRTASRIHALNNNIIMAYAGDQTAGRSLCEAGMKECVLMYPDSDRNVGHIANYIFGTLHKNTLCGNTPLSLLNCVIGGFDADKSSIFKVNKNNVEVGEKAVVIGCEEKKAQKFLDRYSNHDIDELTGIMLALGCFKHCGQTVVNNIEVGVLNKGNLLRMISKSDITDYINNVEVDK